mmetsp:Transcript_10045/g.15114  ORF Transcript_10045/g.15114 Transcript_10045/m.15114 type:complete len:112 (-) Transcript_10045:53-388(-)
MVKQKNHTGRNKTVRDHKNGIKKPRKHRYESLKGMCPHFLRGRKEELKKEREGKKKQVKKLKDKVRKAKKKGKEVKLSNNDKILLKNKKKSTLRKGWLSSFTKISKPKKKE